MPLPGGRIRSCSNGPLPPEARALLDELRADRPAILVFLMAGQSPKSLDCNERFGVASARLYPSLGKHVQHRSGRWGGRLLSVRADCATVHVSGEPRVRRVNPWELLP